MKLLLASVCAFFFSTNILANELVSKIIKNDFRIHAALNLIDWEVGDHAEYNLRFSMGSGTAEVTIREQVGDNFWINQQLSLGPLGGDHLVELLVNPATGEVLKMIVDGNEQDAPEQGEIEVISIEEVEVVVPAGTFTTQHVTIKDVESGKISEQWVNQQQVPVYGLVKNVSPEQLREVSMELTGFGRAYH
ncbi:MAG: hypothetical protein R3B45_12490 [Bdellovibrionota bacterium]